MTYHLASERDITTGRATDAYFDRTEQALEYSDTNPTVVAEITADQFPTGDYNVFAGLEDAANLLEGLPIDVDAIEEGRLYDGGPVMRITGDYLDFARYETALLGFLSHATGVATNALIARQAAPNTTMLSFGARHVNPAIGPMIERSAIIGGADGYSFIAAEDSLEQDASGTMPHALMLAHGRNNQEDAWDAFKNGVDETVPRIALCDTYTDEVQEVIEAVETFGNNLDGVRLDTTGSRRGDFEHIIKEVQWQLDAYGYPDVDIYVSGGLGPADMKQLREHVDGFGIGGFISNADPEDFSLDIVERDAKPISKRGKLAGVKEVYRTDDGHAIQLRDKPAPDDAEELLKPLIRDGEVVREFSPEEAAQRAQKDADALNFPTED